MASVFNKLRDFMLGPEYDEEEEYEDARQEDLSEVEPTAGRGSKKPSYINSVSSMNSSSSAAANASKIVSIHTNVQIQIVVSYPKVVNDSSEICDYIKDNKTVIVNLDGLDREETQRIVDFLSGAAYAINGDFQSISGRIFIVAPPNVEITGQFKEELKASGIIFPWLSQK